MEERSFILEGEAMQAHLTSLSASFPFQYVSSQVNTKTRVCTVFEIKIFRNKCNENVTEMRDLITDSLGLMTANCSLKTWHDAQWARRVSSTFGESHNNNWAARVRARACIVDYNGEP